MANAKRRASGHGKAAPPPDFQPIHLTINAESIKYGPQDQASLAPAEPAPAPPRQHYVVGFLLERPSERVLLLRKLKPSWQRGVLNGVGGKKEFGKLRARP